MNETSKKHIDSCRFCWMCRHICPIGNATGLERNTARARALGLSLVNRKVYDISQVIENVYECACCGACTNDCVTGWDPVMFTKDARLDAALEDKLPDYIKRLVENCLETGNAYGITDCVKDLSDEISAHEEKTDTLLFLGVDARYKAQDSAVKAIKALEKTGIKFTVLANEPASGQQLEYLVGASDETKQQMSECAQVLNNYKTVIIYDPQDAVIIKRTYGEWNINLDAKAVTYTSFLADMIKSGKLKTSKKTEIAALQDPFQLSRDLKETEEPREIVSAFRNTVEMLINRKDTMWAGNILMAEWMPDVMLKVAKDRIVNAKNMGAQVIVCASVSEYTSLKKVTDSGIKILSVEELILD